MVNELLVIVQLLVSFFFNFHSFIFILSILEWSWRYTWTNIQESWIGGVRYNAIVPFVRMNRMDFISQTNVFYVSFQVTSYATEVERSSAGWQICLKKKQRDTLRYVSIDLLLYWLEDFKISHNILTVHNNVDRKG
jgi:hypothetical protein